MKSVFFFSLLFLSATLVHLESPSHRNWKKNRRPTPFVRTFGESDTEIMGSGGVQIVWGNTEDIAWFSAVKISEDEKVREHGVSRNQRSRPILVKRGKGGQPGIHPATAGLFCLCEKTLVYLTCDKTARKMQNEFASATRKSANMEANTISCLVLISLWLKM